MSRTEEKKTFEVTNRIAVYKTGKNLLEFVDKLNPSYYANYAEMHGWKYEDTKCYSNIGVTMLDYANGTGEKTVSVKLRISPETVLWILSALQSNKEYFDFTESKIFGEPVNGYSQCTKIRVVRVAVDQNTGEVRKYPWFVIGENGIGKPATNKNGGTFCQSGSYTCQSKVSIALSDYDLFALCSRTARYIQQFENTFLPSVIQEGKQAWNEQLKRLAEENDNEKKEAK